MTYKKLFDLKYRKNVSTYELIRLYPKAAERVWEIALLEVPEVTLRQVLCEEKTLERVIELKKKFLKEEVFESAV